MLVTVVLTALVLAAPVLWAVGHRLRGARRAASIVAIVGWAIFTGELAGRVLALTTTTDATTDAPDVSGPAATNPDGSPVAPAAISTTDTGTAATSSTSTPSTSATRRPRAQAPHPPPGPE